MKTLYNFSRRYLLSLLFLVAICVVSIYPASSAGIRVSLYKYDKLAHFLMYASFCTVVWYEYLKSHVTVDIMTIFRGAVVAPVLIGGLLEYVQGTFTATRSADYLDFLFNLFGVLFAAMMGLLVIMPILRRSTAKKNM
jgi:VanZ family protein